MENTEMQTMPQTSEIKPKAAGFRYSSSDLILDPVKFNQITALGNMLSSGAGVSIPVELKGKPGDCALVVMQSIIWDINPLAVMAEAFVINGKISYSGKLVHTILHQSGAIAGDVGYEFFGDWHKIIGKYDIKTNDKGKQYRVPAWKLQDEEGLGVIVSATLAETGITKEYRLLLSQCAIRNSTEWATDTQQQICYIGVRKFVRRHCPWVLSGVYAKDEMDDDFSGAKELNGQPKAQSQPLDIGSKGKSQPDSAGAAQIIARINACKTSADVEALRQEVGALKGNPRKEAVAAFHEKMNALTVSGEVVHKKSFAEIEEQINANPSSALEFVTPELIAHLPKDQQTAISKLANTVFDSTLK